MRSSYACTRDGVSNLAAPGPPAGGHRPREGSARGAGDSPAGAEMCPGEMRHVPPAERPVEAREDRPPEGGLHHHALGVHRHVQGRVGRPRSVARRLPIRVASQPAPGRTATAPMAVERSTPPRAPSPSRWAALTGGMCGTQHEAVREEDRADGNPWGSAPRRVEPPRQPIERHGLGSQRAAAAARRDPRGGAAWWSLAPTWVRQGERGGREGQLDAKRSEPGRRPSTRRSAG
jgi:hypothetical protein